MKLIRLMCSDSQQVRWWQRYYVFEPRATVVDTYYELTSVRHIGPTKAEMREEVVFDYWTKRVVPRRIIMLLHSNIRVQQFFKVKYEFTFDLAHKAKYWFSQGKQFTLQYPIDVVPNIPYTLNTNTSRLSLKYD